MTLPERYIRMKHQFPFWGDIGILRMAIEPGDTNRVILKAFNKFVSTEDYAPEEKREILGDLYTRGIIAPKVAP
jgi:hypothetical protein